MLFAVALSRLALAADPTLIMPIRAEGLSAGEVRTVDTLLRTVYTAALGRPIWPVDTALTGVNPTDTEMIGACRRVGCDKFVVVDVTRTGRVIVVRSETRGPSGKTLSRAAGSAIDFNHLPDTLVAITASLESGAPAPSRASSSAGVFIGFNTVRSDLAFELGPTLFLDTGPIRTSLGAGVRVVSARGELLPSFSGQGCVGWRESTGDTRLWAGAALVLSVDRTSHATVASGPELGLTFNQTGVVHPFLRARAGGSFDHLGAAPFGSLHGGLTF